ncbi:restriction endonuclease subunit S [Cohnella hongkongensis]|uniref:Restriction endonuclease subunit S n=1 Tax=Cohnella hongkongensis TaxID=178337 RepID=A0ABV9FGN1_9BACL
MKVVSVSEVAKITSGFAFKSEMFNEENNGFPLIRIRDVGQNNPATYYSGEYREEYLVSKGDLLISMDGEFKISEWLGPVSLLNQRVCKIQSSSPELLEKYLLYILPDALKRIEDATPFVTVKHLSVSDIKKIQIILPTISEQKHIIDILAKAQALIDKRKQAIAKLDELVQVVFMDMFGNPVTNPMGWEVQKLKSLSTRILSGNTPKGGSQVYVETGIIFFRSQNIWKNRIELDDVAYIDEQTHRKMSQTSLKNRDILITKTGRINTENSSLGRAALFLGEDDSANINGHVYLVRLKKEVIHEFVLYILISDEYRDYIREVCVGGIDKRQINKEHLEEFPIIMPPIELQQRFADYVRQIDILKSKMQQGLKDLESNFQALLQKAFKGELKVKDGVAV